MGRYNKVNFEYFPMNVNFFSGKKIKALKRACGPIGLLTYEYILCYVYGNGGHSIHVDDLEEFAYDIAESITSENIAKTARRVTESITCQTEIGLLDKASLARGVITSHDIQRQYMNMCVQSRRKFDKSDLFLLSEADFNERENKIYAEEKGIYAEEKGIYAEEMPYKSKINNKERNIKERKDYCGKKNPFVIRNREYTEEEYEAMMNDDLDKIDF